MKLGWEKSRVRDISPKGWSAPGARSSSERGEPAGSVPGWERQCLAGWKGQSNAGHTLGRRQLPGLDSGSTSPVPWGCGCTCHPDFWSQSEHRAPCSRTGGPWHAQASLLQSPALHTDPAAAASVLSLCRLPPGTLSALINVTV